MKINQLSQKLFIIPLLVLSTSIVTFSDIQAAEIPDWVKDIVTFWAAGEISDSEFISALEYLINENIINVEQTSIADFVDGEKDPQYYIDRYNNEPEYKKWFDTHYSELSIYEAVGINSPTMMKLLEENNQLKKQLGLQSPDQTKNSLSVPDTTTKQNIQTESHTSLVSQIKSFNVINGPDDDFYDVRFSLERSDKKEISSDGQVLIRFVDDLDNILYSDEFFVQNSDFETYEYTFTGETFLAYIWNIPTSEVEKGLASFLGTAKLIFVDQHGNEFKSTTNVSIPKFTDEELVLKHEEEYNDNFLAVDESISSNSLTTTLLKVGPYTTEVYGDLLDGFRADFVITNEGSEATYIPNSIILLDKQGNQFEKSYHSDWDWKEIYPGVTYSGYVFFENYVGDSPEIQIIMESYDDTKLWDVDLSQ